MVLKFREHILSLRIQLSLPSSILRGADVLHGVRRDGKTCPDGRVKPAQRGHPFKMGSGLFDVNRPLTGGNCGPGGRRGQPLTNTH